MDTEYTRGFHAGQEDEKKRMRKQIQTEMSVKEQKEIYKMLGEEGRRSWSDLYETFNVFTAEELELIKNENKYLFETYEGEKE